MLERYFGFPKNTHRYIFLGSTFLIGIALPVSYFALSVAQITLAANWLTEGGLKQKLKLLYTRKSILVFLGIYFVHLMGVLKGGDWQYILHDLRIKLPIMALPLIYATTPSLSEKQLKTAIILYILSVLAGTFICYAVSLGFTSREVIDYRDISIFISHIRFSLMIVLAICFCLLYAAESFTSNRWTSIAFIVIMIWMMYFLSLLGSLTGMVIMGITFPLTWLLITRKKTNRTLFRWSLIAGSIFLLGMGAYFGYAVKRFNTIYPVDLGTLKKNTANGNQYVHYTQNSDIENGHLVFLYICPVELEKEWNMRSHIPFDSTDKSGQLIEYTIYRYLTSMGLTKDSVGVAQLSEDDIGFIEKGYANYIYKHKAALYPKIYRTLWEINHFKKYNDPNFKTILQRREYLKTGWNVYKRFPVFGTGNGHLVSEYNRQYEIDNTPLLPEKRFRAHNQLFTFMITFGIVGFMMVLMAHIFPVLYEKKLRRLEFVTFYIILLLSYLNEDTLETHAGVSFAAFFIGLLLFGTPSDRNDKT